MLQTPKNRHFQHTLFESFLFLALFLFLIRMSSAHCNPNMKTGKVGYWQLQRMNASCYPKDSCREERLPEQDNLDNYNCLCSRSCVELSACCVDSKYRLHKPSKRVVHGCVQIYGQSKYVYMVDNCSPDWNGDPYIAELCSGNAEDFNDPMLLVPVTNSKSRITYKNYFCAACNGDDSLRHCTFWPVTLTSYQNNISQSELSNLKYSSRDMDWILQNPDDDSGNGVITINLDVPAGGHVETCPRGVIASCALDWPDDVTKRKCASYMAMVGVSDARLGNALFKNVHCAICNNNPSYDNLVCNLRPSTGFSIQSEPDRRPLSFALLLDVNRSDGDRVGEIQRCPDNQLFDPFFKKCRVLKCALPGYVIKDGACARQ